MSLACTPGWSVVASGGTGVAMEAGHEKTTTATPN